MSHSHTKLRPLHVHRFGLHLPVPHTTPDQPSLSSTQTLLDRATSAHPLLGFRLLLGLQMSLRATFRAARSPTRPEQTPAPSESPHPSPQRSEYDLSNGRGPPPPSYHSSYDRSTPSRQGSYGASTSATPDTSVTVTNQTSRQLTARPDPPTSNPPSSISTSSDNLKSFKVSLEDPAWKVLPAALKKYKINNDDWQNYAMFICYGNTGKLHSTL